MTAPTHSGACRMSHIRTARHWRLSAAALLIKMERMDIKHLDYARLSEAAMAAADSANSLVECQALLAQAVRYVSLACVVHQGSADLNVVQSGPERGGSFDSANALWLTSAFEPFQTLG